jgi:protocatechuate 3,4-dioxygenase beta subunit
MLKKLVLLICFFLWISNAYSTNDYRIDIFNPLPQTPSALIVDNLSKPRVFNKNNNLTRKTGSFNVAIGEPLYIKGKIIDAFKIPIEGAIVKIWQTNASGKYHTLLNRSSKFIDQNFVMSGQSVSDNLGNYEFITIFPGYYDDRAPHINFIISHKRFGIIETEVYFEKHFRNETDPVYLSYPEDDKKKITATMDYVDIDDMSKGKIATFNIVMDGIHQYKRY